jgi:hypothetical protein
MGLGAGAPFLGSLFDRLLPEAMGAVAPGRRRFLLITHGGGLLEENYTCKTRDETDFDLTPVMSPLEPYKKDLLVLSKFFVPIDKRQHGNQFAALSMKASTNQVYGNWAGRPAGGISIDRFLAGRIGSTDAFSSLSQGIEEGAGFAPTLSADGPGQEHPAIGSPVKAYERYFAKAMTGGGGQDVQALLARDKSLLDAIRGDITRMNARLATAERAKLQQYTDSLRGLERQLTQLVQNQPTCDVLPAKPTVGGASLNPNVIAAHIDVAFQAHRCGLTRVSHMSIHGFSSPHNHYGWLGDKQGFHECNHTKNRPIIDKISTYIFEKVAQMAGLLAGTQEGNGTMLDSSLVVFLNTCGGKHHDGHDTYSVITLGKAGGALRTGRVVNYPPKQHTLADVWVSCLNAMGVEATTFGEAQHCKGPLPGLT